MIAFLILGYNRSDTKSKLRLVVCGLYHYKPQAIKKAKRVMCPYLIHVTFYSVHSTAHMDDLLMVLLGLPCQIYGSQ